MIEGQEGEKREREWENEGRGKMNERRDKGKWEMREIGKDGGKERNEEEKNRRKIYWFSMERNVGVLI
jgi:hypothetical protein